MKRLLSFSMFCLAMAIAPLAHCDSVVIHGDFVTTEGNGGGESTALGRFTNTVLTVYNESVVAAAGINPGDTLTGLAFRVDGGTDAAPNFTVDNYIFELGRSLNSAGALDGDDFASNFDGGPTTVRSGALDFRAADYATGNPNNSTGTANAFGPEIVFDNFFTYTGGDLLIRYTHTDPLALDGSLVTSRADSINTTFDTPDFSEPGVHTLFGEGYNANTRFTQSFGSALTVAPILQFTVVPEPTSAVLLMGIGMIGVAARRRRQV